MTPKRQARPLIRVAKSDAKRLIRAARRASYAARRDFGTGLRGDADHGLQQDRHGVAVGAAADEGPRRLHQRHLRAAVAVKPGFALPAARKRPPPRRPSRRPAEEPLPVLLAKADAAKGQADTKVCQSCHSFEKGGAAKVGPPLWGVVGRPKASSPALPIPTASRPRAATGRMRRSTSSSPSPAPTYRAPR